MYLGGAPDELFAPFVSTMQFIFKTTKTLSFSGISLPCAIRVGAQICFLTVLVACLIAALVKLSIQPLILSVTVIMYLDPKYTWLLNEQKYDA